MVRNHGGLFQLLQAVVVLSSGLLYRRCASVPSSCAIVPSSWMLLCHRRAVVLCCCHCAAAVPSWVLCAAVVPSWRSPGRVVTPSCRHTCRCAAIGPLCPVLLGHAVIIHSVVPSSYRRPLLTVVVLSSRRRVVPSCRRAVCRRDAVMPSLCRRCAVVS